MFLRLADLIYCHIFHEEMTSEVKAFLKNILYIGIGTAISTLFMIVFTILGGRLLGPEEYGKFTLIQSVAMFLYIPMLLGFDTAMLKYTSEKPDYQRQSNIIVSTYLLVLFSTAAFIGICFIFASSLSKLFGISTELFYLAVAFAALFAFYTLTTSVLRGLNRMRVYSIFQIVYGSLILLSFLAFIINRQLSFQAMIYPMFLAYGITTILIIFLFISKLTKYRFNISIGMMLSKYAIFNIIGGLSYVLYSNVDKIMISNYMNLTSVGIYSAYYTASISVAAILWGIFNLVMFPTISGYKNKSPVFYKINKLLPYLICLGIPFILVCESIILTLYGNQYSLNILWLIYFAIASICVVIEGLYNWLLWAIGLKGVKISSFSSVIVAVINIGFNYVLIPKIGISGAIISLIIAYLFSIFIKLWLGRNYLRKGMDEDLWPSASR